MDYLLIVVIVLFIFLSFGFKEGYYSDINTSAASSAMTVHIDKLNTLQGNLTTLNTQDITVDANSKLNPLLHPVEDSKYSAGLLQQAFLLSDRISKYQDNLIQLTEAIPKTKMIMVTFKEYVSPLSKETVKTTTLPLPDAIEKLIKDAQNITKELNQIPDS